MEQKLFFFTFLFTSNFLIGQNISRIEVHGIILSNSNDVEAVTVYNTSSNKGTITNEKGEFVLAVTENDIFEISALQFEAQKVTITKEVITSKSLKIYLAEQLNQLDAVLLFNGLTGSLAADIQDVEIPPKIEIDLGNMDVMEFYDDKAFDNSVIENELNHITNKGGLYNGVDFVKIAKMLFKKRASPEDKPYEKPKMLVEVYSQKYLSDTFNIPLELIEEFIAFVENNGLTQELLNDENEFERIDFLVKQSQLFLKQEHAKK